MTEEQIKLDEETKTSNTIQTIYIDMDDSGVLHLNDQFCIYGGVCFASKDERDTFVREYKKIVDTIKCYYCKSKEIKPNCNHKCPEIKDTNITPKHKRWLFNLVKRQTNYAVIINNQKITSNKMETKQERGRFRDYCQRRIIKEILKFYIQKGNINPNNPVKLIIRIDQQGTSTDTNRQFVEDIKKELTIGHVNFNYQIKYSPILFSDLEVDLKYVLSHTHECIQASDFVAGETRRAMISQNVRPIHMQLEYLNIRLLLP